MAKITVNCVLLGTSLSNSFTVDICNINDINGKEVSYDQLKIGHLKYLIWCEKKNMLSNTNYSDMTLWRDRLKELSKEIVSLSQGEELMPTKYFWEYFEDQNYADKSIIIVQVPDNPNKRIKLDEDLNSGFVHKTTTEYLQDLLRPFDEPVSIDNINQYLNASLLEKLPANYFYSLNYPELLDHSKATILPDLCSVVDIVMGSYEEKPNQEMVTSHNVNCHINLIITIVGKYINRCRLEWVRNNKIDEFTTTTNRKRVRPDVTVYYKGVLVMMGEEKDVHSKLLTAAEELDDYFSFWNTLAFGDLPLVFGFAAGGTQIQFYYYHVIDSSKKPVRVEIGDPLSFGTDNKLNNLKALQYTINIIRIFRTFDECGVIQTPLLKLFNVIYRDHGASITIAPEKVAKSIPKESIKDEKFHRTLYQTILPGLGHYKNVEYKTTKSKIYLTFGPVGYLSIPKSENDLRCAILNILEDVDKLHDEKVGVVHRDIRWDNVVKLTDGKWMLIDFEEAAKIGDERTTLRIVAPEYENGNDKCQASGDIWMIGKLIDDSRIKFSLSGRAQNFRDRLMSEDPNQRPTAADAIKDDWFKGME